MQIFRLFLVQGIRMSYKMKAWGIFRRSFKKKKTSKDWRQLSSVHHILISYIVSCGLSLEHWISPCLLVCWWGCFISCKLLWWVSGEYPLFTLLPKLLSFVSDNPKSVHNEEFCMLFRTKIASVLECFWIRRARNKHMNMLSVIRTSLMGTRTL